jgi:ABC-2 type transport system permease protein
MRALMAIAWKDFKSLCTSPIFLIISGLFCSLLSFTYIRQIFDFAQRSSMMAQAGQNMNLHMTVFASHLSLVNLILLLAIPVFTMRALAEEKKMRTYDLLLTAPITATQISVGKFLAVFGCGMILLLLAALYPIGTALFADFNWGPFITSFIGLALLMGIYIAIGLFASSVTSSVILAAFLGMVLILGFWFVGQGAGLSDDPFWSAFFEHVSVGQQFISFLRGTLKLSAVVYMVSTIVLFVFLTQRVVESSRWR